MQLGGNANLSEFFQHYDLNEESVQMRYRTKAAEFYRARVSLSCTQWYIVKMLSGRSTFL